MGDLGTTVADTPVAANERGGDKDLWLGDIPAKTAVLELGVITGTTGTAVIAVVQRNCGGDPYVTFAHSGLNILIFSADRLNTGLETPLSLQPAMPDL